MPMITIPQLKPGQAVVPVAGSNVILNKIVQIVQIMPTNTAGDPPLYHVLNTDNTMTYVYENQMTAKK
jgi:hypothetical protein